MKTRKISFILLLSLLVVPMAWAQKSDKKAVEVLSKTVNILMNNTVETYFGLVVIQPGSKEMQKMKGKFILKGNKFVLNMDDMSVFFDGTTQWAYVPDFNEVSITTPTDEELAETNPMALLQAYKEKSTIRFTTRNVKKNAFGVELTPKASDKAIKKIVVQVNKINYYPLSIQLVDKNGMISTLALSNFTTDVSTTNQTFVFDTSKHDNIEINDLR